MESCFYESISEEGGNRSARRKPSKSGWDRLKLNPHTTLVVEVEGVNDVRYASLTSQGVQHRVLYRDGHPSRYQPRPTGLNFGEQTGTGVFPLVIAVPHFSGTFYLKWSQLQGRLLSLYWWNWTTKVIAIASYLTVDFAFRFQVVLFCHVILSKDFASGSI